MVPMGTVARGRVHLQSASQAVPPARSSLPPETTHRWNQSRQRGSSSRSLVVQPKLVSVCLPFSSVTGAAPLISPTSHNTAEAATPSCLESWCSLLFLLPPSAWGAPPAPTPVPAAVPSPPSLSSWFPKLARCHLALRRCHRRSDISFFLKQTLSKRSIVLADITSPSFRSSPPLGFPRSAHAFAFFWNHP